MIPHFYKTLSLIIASIFLLVFSFSTVAKPEAVETVRLQLKWFHQFQFAGYYAAIEKGFYAEEGLNVEIKERILEKNFVKQVVMGEAEYGVGDSGLISQYAKGEPIIALAAIFQHNPLVFMARQDSGIISPFEMIGKRVMSDVVSSNEAPLQAMLIGANIKKEDYTVVPQSNDYDLLTRKEVDVISGYLTDQPFYFKQIGLKINIINPQNYGIDFYGDLLFTSQHEWHQHADRVERFRRASLKGWTYALDHPEELIQIIHDKYHSKLPIEHLRFEAVEARKLILPDIIPVGRIEPGRMKMVANIYATSGFNRPLTEEEIIGFIYQGSREVLQLSDEEKAWLDAHPVIRVGIDRDFAPYEKIDEKGNYVGMAADYIRLIEKKLGIRFDIIRNKSWTEILAMAKRNELDMIACAVNTPERSQYLTFTKPYKSAYAIIIDNGQGNFIGDLRNLSGKRVAVEKGYFMQEMLQKNYPQIQLIAVGDTRSALNQVLEGKADAYVGDADSANYVIKKDSLLNLRFSGQTEYFSQHSVAITKNNPELAAIIGKAMTSIPKSESDAIFTGWLGLKIEQGIKIEALINYGIAVLALFVLFIYWVSRLQREIKERKQAEKNVQALLKEQKIMLETDLFGIAKVKNRTILWSNPFFEKMLGYSAGELVGASTFKNFVTKEAYDDFGATAYPILQSGNVYRTQLEHICKDGHIIWVDMSGSLLDLDSGESLWAFVDITERKLAEDKLRDSSLYSRSLIEASLDPLVTISTGGKIMDVNQATETVTGLARNDLIGSDFSNYFTEPDKAQFGYQKAFSEGFVTDFPLVIRHQSGQLTDVLYNTTVYRDLEGHVQGVFAAARDVTDRKKMEDALRQARDLAEQAAIAKSAFLANMSHEIRTPMNAIIGLSQLALNKPVPNEVRDYLQKIHSSSVNLLGILNDILDFSKMEAGKLKIEKAPFDLSTIQGNIYSLFSAVAEHKKLGFSVDIMPETPMQLVGDALRIQQILSNLVSNALKFTDSGKVCVKIALLGLESAQAKIRFCVSDTGIGLSPADQAKLYQPFSQVDDSITRRFGGTGLGLAISHKLLILMGGIFHINSSLGKGTTFCFDLTLEVAVTDLKPDIKLSQNTRKAGALTADLRELSQAISGSHILVAEDNIINQQIVKEFLHLVGISVDIANTGIAALQLLENNTYDAVIMDVHMPEMGGVAATEQLRKQSQFNSLPIIAFTAGVTQEERDKCLACGMNDFIAKPLDPEALINVLNRWIKKPLSE